ncbi:hypothetical protein PTKIN_Ptkin06aG0118200 [Pterospermum kingtungense]
MYITCIFILFYFIFFIKYYYKLEIICTCTSAPSPTTLFGCVINTVFKIIGRKPTTRQEEEEIKMGLKEEFEEYAEKAKTLPENTTNENKLILYGLYKQATVGPVNTSRPGMFNMRDRAKWDAWKAVEGKSKEEAMGDYITKVKQLQEEAAASS